MYPSHTGHPVTKSLVEDPCGALEHDPPAGVQVCVARPMSCGFHAEKVVGLESLRSNILVRPGSG